MIHRRRAIIFVLSFAAALAVAGCDKKGAEADREGADQAKPENAAATAAGDATTAEKRAALASYERLRASLASRRRCAS
jgi:hypothetical protein